MDNGLSDREVPLFSCLSSFPRNNFAFINFKYYYGFPLISIYIESYWSFDILIK